MSMLILPPHIPQYTAEALVQIAQQQGFAVTTSRVYEWSDLGLIGKSQEGRWNQHQCDLWIRLLRAKHREAIPVNQLFNLPVGMWLLVGDDSGVALPQVRRAMLGWAVRHQRKNGEVVRAAIQRTINMVKNSRTFPVLEAKKRLQAIYRQAGAHDYTEIRYLLDIMFGDTPNRTQDVGPAGLPLTAALLADLWETREHLFLHYDDLALTTWLWEWVRAFYSHGVRGFLDHRPTYAQEVQGRHDDLQHLFRPLTFDDLVSSACIEVLTLLALGSETVAAITVIPHLPDHLQPLAWQRGEYEGQLTAQFVPHPLAGNVTYQQEYIIRAVTPHGNSSKQKK